MDRLTRTYIVADYFRKHGYEVVDIDAMPFNHGITMVDLIVYDRLKNEMVSVKIYSRTLGRENIMSEWMYRDEPYYRRAIKRWCEKQRWRFTFRNDMVVVEPGGCIDHCVGNKIGKIKRRSR